MAADALTFRIAQRRIDELREEQDRVLVEHQKADECRDCDDYVGLLIQAVASLKRARDEAARQMPSASPEPGAELRSLAKSWLVMCARAEVHIAAQRARGFNVQGSADLPRLKCEVEAMLTSAENRPASRVQQSLQDQHLTADEAARISQALRDGTARLKLTPAQLETWDE